MTTTTPAMTGEEQTSTDVARPGGSMLVVASEQTFWNAHQIAALNQIGVQNASNADLGVFFHQCTRTGLDPFLRQIYMIEREGKQTIQTGIDGFRLVARRAVERSGETYEVGDILWCGKDGQWGDVWIGEGAPHAAKAIVYRDGRPFSAVALYDEFAGKKRDGSLNSMWKGKQSHMIGKCAEALAHRKAFPQDLSGIYTEDELAHEVIEHVSGESVKAPTQRITADEIRARRAPAPGPTSEPVDAVVVEPETPIAEPAPAEEPPAEEPATAEPTPGTGVRVPVTRSQLGKIQTVFNSLGCRDKVKRLAVVVELISRPINDSMELTTEEADMVFDSLSGINGAEQFDDMFANVGTSQ